MPALNLTEVASLALFVLTGLLLTYASIRTPTIPKRIAALASFVTISGAVYFMMAARSGNDGWWTFERPGPMVRRAIKDRGHFEWVDEDGPQAGNGGNANKQSAGAGAGRDGADGEETGALARIAALMKTPQSLSDTSPVMSDCADCPDLIPIPANYFRMGPVRGDAEAQPHEFPARHVMIRTGYAIGRTEVTIAQYSAFVRDTGRARPACGFEAPERDYRLPVHCISWRDAVAYTQWLSERTRHAYRLPTEAEWQHAASGGSAARFTQGSSVPAGEANLGSARFDRKPAGSFKPNGYGLHDVHGNVAEMVADCWADTLARIPGDGRRWNIRGDCSRRVLKDAHAGEAQTLARLSARRSVSTTERRPGVGFRVIREF